MDVVAETEDPHAALLWTSATGWVGDEPLPGVVQVEFHEEDGTTVVIREKAAVVDSARCTPDASYPRSVVLACRILAATTRTYDVELAHHVEDLHGRTRFTVHYENVDLCRYDELEFEDSPRRRLRHSNLDGCRTCDLRPGCPDAFAAHPTGKALHHRCL